MEINGHARNIVNQQESVFSDGFKKSTRPFVKRNGKFGNIIVAATSAGDELQNVAFWINHENIHSVISQNFMQSVSGKTENFLNIDGFLNVVIDRMKIFEAHIQVTKPPLEFSPLPVDGDIQFIESASPFMYLLRGFADQKTEDAENKGCSCGHIGI